MQMVKVSEVKFLENVYPRLEVDKATVALYQLGLDSLPPITVTQDGILVDGYHRLTAYRLEGKTEIPAEVVECEDETVILIEAIRRNSTHGKQLTREEKKTMARRLCELGRDAANIGDLVAVPERTVREWTRDIREARDKERDATILRLWLACKTQEEIAEVLGVHVQTVKNVLAEYKNGSLAEIVPSSLQLYDVWTFAQCDPQYGHGYPGRIPGQIVENVLHYYTQPFDTVVDPMAGSGTTVDVCKAMYRRYRAYDIRPTREDIGEWDVAKGLPKEAKGANLIFLDPPYWSMKKDEYTPGSAADLDLQGFYAFIGNLARSCYENLAPNGVIAFLIQNQTGKQFSGKDFEGHDYLDHGFECYGLFLNAGFHPVRRISVPIHTQTIHPQQVTKAKEDRRMLGLVRDLLIFRKGSAQ